MHAVNSRMACPDHPGADIPGVFERAILRGGWTVGDSIIIEAVSQYFRSCVVTPTAAVAAINALIVIELVVDLDVELIIRRIGRIGENEVIEFHAIGGLGIKINDSLPDGINFVRRDHVQWPVICDADLQPRNARIAAGRWVVDMIRQSGEVASALRHGWHRLDIAGRRDAADFLEINEEECIVLLDRAAERKASLISL